MWYVDQAAREMYGLIDLLTPFRSNLCVFILMIGASESLFEVVNTPHGTVEPDLRW